MKLWPFALLLIGSAESMYKLTYQQALPSNEVVSYPVTDASQLLCFFNTLPPGMDGSISMISAAGCVTAAVNSTTIDSIHDGEKFDWASPAPCGSNLISTLFRPGPKSPDTTAGILSCYSPIN